MNAILRRLFGALVIVVIVPLTSAFFSAPALADGYQPSQRAAVSTYPSPCLGAVYVVQSGDDLFHISSSFGVNPYRLQVYNGLRHPDLIYVGMRLKIPCTTNYVRQPGYSRHQPGYSRNRPGYPRHRRGYPSQPGYPSQQPAYPPSQPPPAPSPAGESVTVVMQNIAFNPATTTIHVGQQVVWRNDDSAPHTTTSGSCSGNVCTPAPGWDSGTLNTGQSFSHTFDTAGTFSYYCRIHGAMMQGTVVVMP